MDGIASANTIMYDVRRLALCQMCVRVCFALLVVLLFMEILVNARLIPRWGPIVIGVIATMTHVAVVLYVLVLLFFLLMVGIVLQLLVGPVLENYGNLFQSFSQAFRMLFDIESLFVQFVQTYEFAHVEATSVAQSSTVWVQILCVGLVFSCWCIMCLVLLNLFISIITELYPKMRRQSETAWENLITGIMAHSTRLRVVNDANRHQWRDKFNGGNSAGGNSTGKDNNNSADPLPSASKSAPSSASSAAGAIATASATAATAVTNVRDYIARVQQHRWSYVLLRHSPFLTFQQAYNVVYARVVNVATQLYIVWDRHDCHLAEAEVYRGTGK